MVWAREASVSSTYGREADTSGAYTRETPTLAKFQMGWCSFSDIVTWCNWDTYYPNSTWCDFDLFSVWAGETDETSTFIGETGVTSVWSRERQWPDPSLGTITVACYGDSLTRGYTGVGIDNYSLLFPATWTSITRGVYGEFGYAGGNRLNSAAASLYTTDHADAVVAMWGTNDFYGFQDNDAVWIPYVYEPFLAAITTAVTSILANSIVLVLCVPPPMGVTKETPVVAARRAAYKEYCLSHFTPLGVKIVDFSIGFPANGLLVDDIHLNTAGQTYVASVIQAVIEGEHV